jgi:autotransporter-associated beta strand protein
MNSRSIRTCGIRSRLLTLGLIAPVCQLQAANGTWNVNAPGNWSNPANWTGGIVAGGATFTADFSTLNITGDHVVTLDIPVTLGTLVSQDLTTTSNSWNFAGPGLLTLDNGASKPALNILNRLPVISAPLAGTNGFTKSGAGTLILSGDNSALSGTIDLPNVTGTNGAGLTLASANALGAVTTVNVGGTASTGQWLALSGGVTVGPTVTINVNSQGGNSAPPGAIRSEGGAAATNVINGPINITGAGVRIGNNAGKLLQLNGVITGGANGIVFRTSVNDGIHVTNSANSWTGITTHSEGILRFDPGALPADSPLIVGASAAGTVHLSGSFNRALGVGVGQVRLGGAETTVAGRALGLSARGGDLSVNFGGAAKEMFFNDFTANPSGTPSAINTNILVLNGAQADSKLTLANPLNLNGTSRTIQVVTGEAELAGGINGGNVTLTKSGTGTLTFSGASDWTGPFVVPNATSTASGWVRVAHSQGLGPDAAVKSISLGSSGNAASGGFELIGGVTVNNKSLAVAGRNVNPENQEFLRNLSGDNAWNGNISITGTGGSYYIRSNAGKLTLGGTLANNIAGGTRQFELKGPGEFLISGTLADGTGLTSLRTAGNTGQVATLTGTNTHSGGTFINAGTTLQVGDGGTTGTLGSGAVTNNGTLRFNYGTGGNLAAANGIGGSGSVVKTGAGTVTISGATTYSGGTDVQQGTLGFDGSFPSGPLTVAPAATLSLANVSLRADEFTGLALDIDGSLALTGPVNIVLAQAAPTGTYNILEYSSITGAGNLTSNYRGTVFNGGATAATMTVGAGVALTWTGAIDSVWDTKTTANWRDGASNPQTFHWGDPVRFDDSGSLAPFVTLTGELRPASVTIDADTVEYFLEGTGTLSGPLSLTKDGDAAANINGNHSFTGGVTVAGGLLRPLTNLALGGTGNAIAVNAGATLDVNGALNANRDYAATIAGSGAGAGAIVNSGASVNSGFGSLTLAADATIGGTGRWDVRPIVAGTGFVDLGGFTLTKSGTNYVGLVDGVMVESGDIELTEGTLGITRMVVSGDGSIRVSNGALLQFENNTTGSCEKDIVLDNGTLRLQGSNYSLAAEVTATNTATLDIEAARTLTLTAPVGGSGDLLKSSDGTAVLATGNSYAGTTTIAAGTLAVGTQTTLGTLGAGPVVNNGTLVINRPDTAYGVANEISGSGSVVIGQGTGGAFDSLVTLTGNNSFSGNLNVSSGGVKIFNAAALGSGAKTVGLTNGTAGRPQFYLDGNSGDIAVPATVGFLTSSTNTAQPAIGNLGGDNSINGPITLTSGGGSTAITVFAGTLALNGNINANVADRRLILGGDADGTINGVVSNGTHPVGIDKTGTGTWTLTGTNSYTGTTAVNEGTLQVNGDQSLASGTVTVAGGAVLGGGGTIGGTLNATSGSTVSPGTGIGTLTTTAPATLSGTLDIELNATTTDRLTVGGSLNLSGATLEISELAAAAQPVYVIASYGLLTGTFASVTGLPAGYSVDYNYNSLNQIALVAGGDAYGSWESANGIGGAGPDVDSDKDGIPNGIEFVIGGDPSEPGSASNALLPTVTVDATYLNFVFRRTDASADYDPFVEYGSNLSGWTEAAAGVDGVVVNKDDDFFGGSVDRITVRIPRALAAPGTRLFARLRVDIP